MKQLLVLLLASDAIRNLAAADNEQITSRLINHEINIDFVKNLYSQIISAQANIKSLRPSKYFFILL